MNNDFLTNINLVDMDGSTFLLGMLSLNIICVLVFMLFSLIIKRPNKVQRKLCAVWGLFMLAVPILGFAIRVFSAPAIKFMKKRELDRDRISFDHNEYTRIFPDVEVEKNFVPLEEALAVSDKKDLRNLMLEILKKDLDNTPKAMMLGLKSNDSEISHYSAAYISEMVGKFHRDVRKIKDEIEENPGEVEAIVAMIEYSLLFLKKQFFERNELKYYVDNVCGYLGILIKKSPLLVKPQYFLDIVNLYIVAGDIDKATEYSRLGMKVCPGTVETYTASLKATYTSGDSEMFFDHLESLKKSKVKIDKELLDLIYVLS